MPTLNRRLPGLMLAITLVAFALRLHDLGTKSLWYDELRQIEVARLPLSEWGDALLAHAARPLDYLITRALLTFTRSEWVLRFPALTWGMLTLPVLYRLGRRLLGPTEAVVGAFLFALSSFGVIFSQELRPYALYGLAATLSYWMLDASLNRNSRWAWLAFAATHVVGVLTHYFWIAIAIGQIAWAAGAVASRQVPARRLAPFVGALAVGGVALLLTARPDALIPMGANFLDAVVSRTFAAPLPGYSLTSPGDNPFAPALTYDYFVGRVLEQMGAGPGFPLILFNGLLLIGVAASLAKGAPAIRPGTLFLLTWLIVGPGLIIGYLLYRNEIFGMRYILFALPPYLLLVARGLVVASDWVAQIISRPHVSRFTHRASRVTLPASRFTLHREASLRDASRSGLTLILLSLAAFTWADARYVTSYYQTPKDDWRRVGKFLAANIQPGDVIVAPNAQGFVEFYFPGAKDYLLHSDAKREAQYAYAQHPRTWFVVTDWVLRDITDTKKLIELYPGVKFQWDKASYVKFTRRGKPEAEMQAEAATLTVPPPSLGGP